MVKMNTRFGGRLAIAIITTAITLPASIASSEGSRDKTIGKRTQAQKVVRRSTVVGSGEVWPNQYVKVTSDLAGRIQKIYVEPGDEVAKGQALVLIESPSSDRKHVTQYSPLKAVVADIPTRVGETV